MVPANLGQEVLRQLTSVGFVEERPIQYPMFGGMTRLKTREVGSQSHSFRMSKQDQGYISPRVNSIRRRGPWIAFPRTTTVEGIVSHDHRRVAHYQRCVSQPGAAWCCLVLTALDKAVEHLYRQHTRLLGKETWTIQYSALDFK